MKTKFYPSERVMKSNPWDSVETIIDQLIDKVILDVTPSILDDQIPDILDDWDNREMAINHLIDKLQKMKGTNDN